MVKLPTVRLPTEPPAAMVLPADIETLPLMTPWPPREAPFATVIEEAIVPSTLSLPSFTKVGPL